MSDEKRNFGGSENVMLKRLGFIILFIGMFPALAIQYWEEVEGVTKYIVIFAVATYAIYHIKGFLKDVFGSKS